MPRTVDLAAVCPPLPKLTPTQKRAYTELRTRGRLWSSSCSSDSRYQNRTLQTLVDLGLASLAVRYVMPHVVPVPDRERAQATAQSAEAAQRSTGGVLTVVVCLSCEGYADNPVLRLDGHGWLHVESGSVRCPGGQGGSDAVATPSRPLADALYPSSPFSGAHVQGRL